MEDTKINLDDNLSIEFDKCVRCGEPSPYPVEYPIEHRNFNMRDIGQLCTDCFKELYNN